MLLCYTIQITTYRNETWTINDTAEKIIDMFFKKNAENIVNEKNKRKSVKKSKNDKIVLLQHWKKKTKFPRAFDEKKRIGTFSNTEYINGKTIETCSENTIL